jgi:hypothetical protein
VGNPVYHHSWKFNFRILVNQMIRLLSQLWISTFLLLLLCFKLSPIIPIDHIAIVVQEYSEIKDEINSKYCGLWCLKTLNNTIKWKWWNISYLCSLQNINVEKVWSLYFMKNPYLGCFIIICWLGFSFVDIYDCCSLYILYFLIEHIQVVCAYLKIIVE